MKSPTTKPKKLVLYRRLSKQKDVKLGNQYGFNSQDWDFDNYLKSLGDHEVIGDFGEFFSARGDFRKRPEFVKALALCRQEGATLVVTKIDRLSRSVEFGSHILNNYDVVVTSQPEADTMMLNILLTVSQNESDLISQRTRAALAAAKRQGVKLGAASPAWQAANKEKMGVHYKRQSTRAVEWAEKYRSQIELMVSMKMSLDGIATKMKELGLKTARGCYYTAGSVKTLIENHLGIDRNNFSLGC